MARYSIRGRTNARRVILLGLATVSLVGLFSYIIWITGFAKSTENIKYYNAQGINNRLYTPTMFNKIGDEYFIVDCWHNRILYSKDPSQPIEKWGRLDTDLAGPHSVVGFGNYIVTEDTGRNAIHFYDREGNSYKKAHTFSSLGSRPHRLVTSPEGKLFLLSSDSQDIYGFTLNQDNIPEIYFTQKLEFLDNTYTRSFGFYEDKILFVRADGYLISAVWNNNKLVEETKIKLPGNFSDPNDVYVYENKIIVTAGKAIGVSDNLLGLNRIENQVQSLSIEGRPYFISEINGILYIPEIANRSRIKAYYLEGSELIEGNTLFDFIGANDASKAEAARLPK